MNIKMSALGLSILVFSTAIAAEEAPTCRWLHLDAETKVFQCAVLSVAETTPEVADAESLPDPTLPLAQQQRSSAAIPAYLQASLDKTEPASASKTVDNPELTDKRIAITAPQQPAATDAAPSEALPGTNRESVPAKDSSRYMVLANGSPEDVKSTLIANNDRDYAMVWSQGKLSVGIYSSRKAAQNRSRALLALGVESEVVPFGQTRDRDSSPTQSTVDWALKTPLGTPDESAGHLSPSRQVASQEIATATAQKVVLVDDSEPTSRVIAPTYLVATLGNQSDILRELQQIGAKDYVALTVEPYVDRVSLGVYSSYANAVARQDQFEQLGIDSELISRNESEVVRSTRSKSESQQAPFSYDQLALRPLEI